MKKRFRFVNFVSAVHTAILILSVVAISLYVLFVHYQDHIAGEARIQSETLSVNGDALRREVFSALSLIRNERKEYDALLRREIINRSHQGLELTQALYEKYKNRMGKKELKALLLNTLASHRFFEGKRGYYFVQGRDGYLYSSAGHPEAQGKHLSQIKNPVSVKMIENLLSLAQKSPEGFNDIRWFVPGESVFRPKLVYYTTFEPYGWYIGTGEYYSIIEKREQKKLLNRLSQIRFHKDSDGYIFIMHSDGTLLMHPFDPESIGKNVLEKTNAEGRKVFQEIQQLAQTQGSGFLTYSWLRPSVGQFEQKLTYVECDKEWNWIVGSGVYLNAIEQKVAAHQQRGRAKLNKEIFNILGATVLILTIFLTLNMVFRYFSGKDLAHFITFFNQAAASGNTIDSSRIRFKEFYVLSLQANRMLGAKKKAEEKLVELATVDSLTTLFNRRHFMELLDLEMERCKRYGIPLSFLALDLDYFKKINDTFGHPTGDHVLKTFSHLAVSCLRNVDIIGRMGGEEFAIFLPQTHLEAAVEVAQRIRYMTESTPITHEGKTFHITVSIGIISSISPQGLSPTDLIKSADKLLYQAKKNGRNQVCSGPFI